MEKIIFIGGGEHCKVAISVLNKLKNNSKIDVEIYGIIDLSENIGRKISNIEIIGSDKDLLNLKNKVDSAFISVGGISDNSKRTNMFNQLKEIGYNLFSIISMDSIIDEDIQIGEGTIIMPGAIINTGVKIGRNVIINTGAIIEHDCIIEDNVHIAPGVVLSGGVNIGAGSLIGTGSSIIQHIKVGENCIIGGGSVVVKDIDSNIVAYGNPCKKVRKNEK